jgi:hypothetical protein
MANSGIFSPNDIVGLMDYQQWKSVGNLELIETQIINTAIARINFTNLGDYDVHFMTATDMRNETNNKRIGVQLIENGVIEDGTVYDVASQFGNASSAFIEVKGVNYGSLRWGDNFGNNTNERMNGTAYFYNLKDDNKYSYFTHHAVTQSESNVSCFEYGSGVMKQKSYVDGISIEMDGGTNLLGGTLSLYGMRFA